MAYLTRTRDVHLGPIMTAHLSYRLIVAILRQESPPSGGLLPVVDVRGLRGEGSRAVGYVLFARECVSKHRRTCRTNGIVTMGAAAHSKELYNDGV